jgi:hypothetical protein
LGEGAKKSSIPAIFLPRPLLEFGRIITNGARGTALRAKTHFCGSRIKKVRLNLRKQQFRLFYFPGNGVRKNYLYLDL